MSKSNKIVIDYIWNKETYIKASRAIYDFNMKHSPKRFLGWIFIAMTQFGVVGALRKDVYGLLIISTLLVIYWYALRWPLRKLILLRSFEHSKLKNHHFKMVFDADGITMENQNIPWNEIKEAIILADGFLLYYQKSFLFIPKTAIQDNAQREKLRNLLQKKVSTITIK